MSTMLGKGEIFLAGATGMSGISILKHILENHPEAKIRASYHLTEPSIKSDGIEYVKGDLRSLEDCRRMVKGCDCAIMAAAYAGGADFVRSFPWIHMRENLEMNIRMLEAFQLENVKRVIFIGSAVVYPPFEGNIKEDGIDFNKNPHDAYFGFGWGMRFIEKMCEFLNMRYGMEIVIVRLANIFGPYDKFNPKFSNFIPALVRKAANKMDPFEVWGTPDVTRDVLFADDFAKAIAMIMADSKIKFEVFNLGSGVRTTVGNVVEWVLRHTQHAPSEIKYIQDKPTTIKFRALDCSKVKERLGWKPEHTIEEGVRITVEWWMENKERWLK